MSIQTLDAVSDQLPDTTEDNSDIMSSSELHMNASDMTDISNVEVS